MGRTHVSGPQFQGPRQKTSTLGNANIGNVMLSQIGSFDFNDLGAAFSLGINIPANCEILQINGFTTAAFTGATNLDLEIGTSTDADAFADIADFHTGGRRSANIDTTQAANLTVTAETEVFATPSVTGTATAGTGHVVVQYVQLEPTS
jgi:hypothetical protein